MEIHLLDSVREITRIGTISGVEPIQVHPERMRLFRPELIRIVWWKQGDEPYTAILVTVSGPEHRKGPGTMAKMERTFWTDPLPEWLKEAKEQLSPEEVKETS